MPIPVSRLTPMQFSEGFDVPAKQLAVIPRRPGEAAQCWALSLCPKASLEHRAQPSPAEGKAAALRASEAPLTALSLQEGLGQHWEEQH